MKITIIILQRCFFCEIHFLSSTLFGKYRYCFVNSFCPYLWLQFCMQPDSNCSDTYIWRWRVSLQPWLFYQMPFFWNAESLTWLLTSCTRHDKVGEENWGLPTHYARNGGMYHHFVANGYRVAKKVFLYGCLFARVFFSTREVCNKSCWKLRRSGPPWDRVRLCNLRSMTQ